MNTKYAAYKHLLNLLANLIMLIVEGGLFAHIWYHYYINPMYHQVVDTFWRRGNWAVIGIYVLIIFFFTKTLNGYKLGYLRLMDLWLSNIIAIVLSGAVGYVEICMVARDYLNPLPIVMIMVIEVGFIILWVYIVRKLYAKLYPPKEVLLIYSKYSPNELYKKMHKRKDRYKMGTQINLDATPLEEIYTTILKHDAVVLADLPAVERNDLLKYCYRNSIRVYTTPKISDILLTAAEDVHLFDTPLLLNRNIGLNIEQQFFKRLGDIICALIGLGILSPFLLITAIMIKSYDGGPVFYKQDRLTKDGREFQILKFRSMIVDSEKNGARLAMKDDDRITPVGKIIRRIHFDEIPQLINILKGDMSLVGPRPERKAIADQYKKDIPEFDFRLKVKAGLTGYAQVYGKYNTTPYDKLKLDLTYIENYKLSLDLRIILLTVKAVFSKDNTEGVDKNQTTAKK